MVAVVVVEVVVQALGMVPGMARGSGLVVVLDMVQQEEEEEVVVREEEGEVGEVLLGLDMGLEVALVMGLVEGAEVE